MKKKTGDKLIAEIFKNAELQGLSVYKYLLANPHVVRELLALLNKNK